MSCFGGVVALRFTPHGQGPRLNSQHWAGWDMTYLGTENNSQELSGFLFYVFGFFSKATEMKDKVLPCMGKNKEQGLFVLRNKNS